MNCSLKCEDVDGSSCVCCARLSPEPHVKHASGTGAGARAGRAEVWPPIRYAANGMGQD